MGMSSSGRIGNKIAAVQQTNEGLSETKEGVQGI
jgi:hypothetical protein